MRKHFKKIIAGTVLLIVIFITAVISLYQHFFDAGVVDMLSISSDGKYVISTDEKEWAVLWNLQTHTKKVLDKHAHIFSAYFIPNTDEFLWQSQDKTIHIENVDGQIIKEFKLPFYIYGIAMPKNSEHFMVGDIGDGQYYCHLTHCVMISKPGSSDPSVFLADQPHVYSIDNANNRYVLGSNLWGVYLWDLNTGKIVHHYQGNVGKTFATLSPNGKYVVSADEDSWQFVWDTGTGQPLVQNLLACPIIKVNEDSSVILDKNVVQPPGDYSGSGDHPNYAFLTVKFVDDTHYLLFPTYTPYAILYETTNPKPLKYLPLGRHPVPSVSYYQRDEAIDTSPSAHILVTGKDNEGGILVYHYDPKNQTLTKVWDGV